MELKTSRLLLLPFREMDAGDVFAYASDPRVGIIAGWPPHQSREESLRIIQTVFAAPGVFAMVLRDTGRVVGSVGFVDEHPAGDCPDCPDNELGYALSPDCWGRGLVPEAVRAVAGYGFTELGFQRIWCGHYAGNWRSARCMGKCGFRYAFARTTRVELLGEDRQTYYYLLTEEAWRGRISGAL